MKRFAAVIFIFVFISLSCIHAFAASDADSEAYILPERFGETKRFTLFSLLTDDEIYTFLKVDKEEYPYFCIVSSVSVLSVCFLKNTSDFSLYINDENVPGYDMNSCIAYSVERNSVQKLSKSDLSGIFYNSFFFRSNFDIHLSSGETLYSPPAVSMNVLTHTSVSSYALLVFIMLIFAIFPFVFIKLIFI